MLTSVATLLGLVLVVIWIRSGRKAFRELREEYRHRGVDDWLAIGLSWRAAVVPPVAQYYVHKYRRERGAE